MMWTIQRGSNLQRGRHSAFPARAVPVASAILHIPACRPHHQPFDARSMRPKQATPQAELLSACRSSARCALRLARACRGDRSAIQSFRGPAVAESCRHLLSLPPSRCRMLTGGPFTRVITEHPGLVSMRLIGNMEKRKTSGNGCRGPFSLPLRYHLLTTAVASGLNCRCLLRTDRWCLDKL